MTETKSACIAGGGDAGRMLRSRDWSGFPLGDPCDWPAALRASVNLVLNSPQAMCLAWGPDLLFFHNDAYAPFLSMRPRTEPGTPFREVWSDVWQDISPIVDLALAGTPSRYEDMPLSTVRKGVRTDTWWSFSYSPLYDEEGSVAGMFCSTSETTGHVRAMAALAESEDRFRNMADNAPVMMWVTDPDGRCVYLNRPWYAFTWQAVEEALGFGWTDAIHPDDGAAAHDAFVAANSAGTSFGLEYRLRRCDGAWRWVVDSAVPRFGPGGEFLGYVGSVLDIDERKEAEIALRESEADYRHAAESNPQTAWTATPDGHLDRVAERWRDWTGSDGTGRSWADAMHPGDRDLSIETWFRSVATGEPYDIEHRARMVDGTYRWMHSRASPRRDADGRIVRWYGTTEDVHERKLAERHLVLMVDELNHRVKNTLATVQSLAIQTFRDRDAFDRSKRDFSQRLLALASAHDLLSARSWSRADLADVVAGSLAHHAEPARVDVSGPSVPLEPKAALSVAMAVNELAANAVRYGSLSGPGGTVAVRWRTEDVGEGMMRLVLSWSESGGPPVSTPIRLGFGTRFLGRGLPAELDAVVAMSYEAEGFSFRIDAVVPAEPKDFKLA